MAMLDLKKLKLMNENLANIYAKAHKTCLETFPFKLTLTTTLKCNYRCKMCYQSSYSGDMDQRLLERIEGFMPMVRSVQVFGGEPLAYKHLDEVIAFSQRYGCELHTITNGSLIDDAMAHKLVTNGFTHMKVSVDAGTPGTYKQIRGGNFFQVVGGLAKINREKQRLNSPFPNVHVNFLAMRSNIHELSKLVVMASGVGVSDVNVFFPVLGKKELLRECLFFHQEESDEQMLKAREMGKALGVHVRLPQLFSDEPAAPSGQPWVCLDPWTTLLVDVDGNASMCCGGAPVLGNLLESDFDAIWNSPTAQSIRRTVNTPLEPRYCKLCRVHKPSSRELETHIPAVLHEAAWALHEGRAKVLPPRPCQAPAPPAASTGGAA